MFRYSGTSPFSGQLLLPGYHGSPGTAATTQLSTLAAVTSSQQQQQLNQQLSYPAPPVLGKLEDNSLKMEFMRINSERFG